MRRDDLGIPGGVWVGVISHRRPANVAKMTALVGPATWVVRTDEQEDYIPAINAASATVMGSAPGVAAARNAALERAFAYHLPCLMLDDDLVKLQVAAFQTVQRDARGAGKSGAQTKRVTLGKRDCDLATLTTMLWDGLAQTGAKLAGVASTDNTYFVDPARPVATSHFINGSFTLTLPTPLRYDTGLRLKEDYDYTLQHLRRYGVVARCDLALAAFQHYSNAGGAVDLRSDATERAAIERILARWPGVVRRNPRRHNEILLAWPRADISYSAEAARVKQRVRAAQGK